MRGTVSSQRPVAWAMVRITDSGSSRMRSFASRSLESVLAQVEVAVLVASGLLLDLVDSAVELDDQPGLVAVEVGDEGSELLLASELQAEDLPAPEELPEDLLRRGLPLPQLAGEVHQVGQRKPSPHEITEPDSTDPRSSDPLSPGFLIRSPPLLPGGCEGWPGRPRMERGPGGEGLERGPGGEGSGPRTPPQGCRELPQARCFGRRAVGPDAQAVVLGVDLGAAP